METTHKKEDIMQVYDVSKVKEYYKIQSGFLFSSQTLIRTDSIKDWKEWNIQCQKLPDVLLINGKEYKLYNLT